jgi:ArsR family transcriptional regulator
VIGDLGCGTGHVSESLAPFVGQVIAVDGSDAMLAEARHRLKGHDNVQIRHGDLEALPIDDAALDAAILALVLHHLPDPGAAMREVARVLRPGGRVLLVDMLPHDREELAKRMGHVWLGLAEETITTQLATAGFQSIRHARLPINAGARGPALFATSAVHAASPHEDISDQA